MKTINEQSETPTIEVLSQLLYKSTLELNELNDNLEKKVQQQVEELRKKDKLLIQSSKLALMGEMIAMIAHQWRQPLNIIGTINMKIETQLDFDEKITSKSYAPVSRDINNQLKFMSQTIDDFRNFFKPSKDLSCTTFTNLINLSLGIIGASLDSKQITIKKSLECDELFTTYTSEVTQVILNIMKNAEDILIEKRVKDPYIKLKTFETDSTIVLEIIDNGGGIPEELIDKIFEPYFSTKLEKNGTGLGLYMSKIIIEEHCNGKLLVRNQEDEVVFTISFDK